MSAFISGYAAPVLNAAPVPMPTTALQAVLLASLLVLVLEKAVLATVQDDRWRRASTGLNVGLLPLGLPPEDPFWSAPAAKWTSQKLWSGENLPADHAINDVRNPDVPTLRRE